jgi:hypothetical protein
MSGKTVFSAIMVFALLALSSAPFSYDLIMVSQEPALGRVNASYSSIGFGTAQRVERITPYSQEVRISGLQGGQQLSIIANPEPGMSFNAWKVEGSCTVSNPNSKWGYVTMGNGWCGVTGFFTSGPNVRPLAVSTEAGSGTVTAKTTGSLFSGTNVTIQVPGGWAKISAIPDAAHYFRGWVRRGGGCWIANSTSNQTTVSDIRDRSCEVVADMPVRAADLRVESLNVGSTYVGVRTRGTVVTKNFGTAAAPKTKTAYYVGGKYLNSVEVPELAPGTSSTGTVTFVCTRSGKYTLEAIPDSEGISARLGKWGKTVNLTCSKLPGRIDPSAPGSQTFASITDSAGKIWSGLAYLLGFGPR